MIDLGNRAYRAGSYNNPVHLFNTISTAIFWNNVLYLLKTASSRENSTESKYNNNDWYWFPKTGLIIFAIFITVSDIFLSLYTIIRSYRFFTIYPCNLLHTGRLAWLSNFDSIILDWFIFGRDVHVFGYECANSLNSFSAPFTALTITCGP